ncbi:MAG: peptide ABC transporter substrate-binding protein [Oscillospiraceae bacterium]|jgi:oligopeptide transport system substrate-binding protein|nr:peptide ABC transporter substrate-binding protein [Oscillospiraceae bacterium]
MRKSLVWLLIIAALLALPMANAAAEPTQELIFALQNEPDGIDPSVTNNSFAAPFLFNVFEGLVTYDTADGSLIPGNAESWTVSEDGLTYTFTLREGLKWSDGSALTAKDYLYAFKRILTPATVAQYLGLVTDYVAGAQDYYDGTGSEEALGVKAPDDRTLVITLTAPAPYFLAILTMWTFDPVQQATVEANGERWTASPDTYVVNGPFKVSEINLGESVVLVKNPEYYDADKVKLEKITFRYITDMGTALMAYESGEVDGSRSFPPTDYARLRSGDNGLVIVPAYATTYYDINNAKAPYDNVLVRKALNLAIDRTSLIEDVIQTPATPAYTLIAPGYVVDGKDFVEGRSTFGLSPTADVEGARAALAEAGYPNGEGFPALQLSYYTNDTTKKTAEALAAMLSENLNITVEISNEDWAVYYNNIQAGNYDIGAMGWGADYLHPMTFLPLLKTGDPNNLVGYSNPAYDELVTKAQGETDPAAAVKLMQDAENIASAEYPLLNLFYRSNTMLLRPKVQGYLFDYSGNIYFKTAHITE